MWLKKVTGTRMMVMAVRPTVQISDGQNPMATRSNATVVKVVKNATNKRTMTIA